MAIIFDTANIPMSDRADGLHAALAESSVSSVEVLGDKRTAAGRLELWPFGACYLFRASTSPVRMFKTERQARRDPAPLLALAVQAGSAGFHRQFAPMAQVQPGTMMAMDMTEPYEFSWLGAGGSRALMMPLDAVGLSTQQLRRAAPRLGTSPLYHLVRRHIVELFRAADHLTLTPRAADLAEVSLELAQALIASVSNDAEARRETAARTLLLRVREYVRRNVRNPELAPAAIAEAHGVSLRHLYSVASAAHVSLEQLIIHHRLRGVRAELSLPAAQFRSIESVARGWGFRNVSHFSRRFTAEFGLTPREWRAEAAATGRQGETE
jgi:AraC-like DNA-binding protein